MAKEFLDVYDDQGRWIGVRSRDTVHREGLWHKTFHCWIGGYWQDEPVLMLQQRSPNKDMHPRLLDISSAGHLLHGESPEDGIREVREELGLALNASDVIFVGVSRQSFVGPNIIDREYCYEYAFLMGQPIVPDLFVLDSSEVAGIFPISLHILYDVFSHHGETLHNVQGWKQTPEGLSGTTLPVNVHSFVPRGPAYYLDWIMWFKQHMAES
ncbi:NUDIX hydrolase [Sulfobacillus thermosulfidooxidans]|uniref:NUDIX hydrolase n=1 Tax=Sulfobacillus thermosulfidooxidans TaxID=28034 RepID=UPI0006B59596|nr:NUDIX domain-containing protein [Sulfobacillus thermosulfidooxidans]